MRVLGIDPGERRIGVAISDPTGTIASPLTILEHVSRAQGAAAIARLAEENGAGLIVIGEALDVEGRSTYQSRKSRRLARVLQELTEIPVEMWDESGSTQAAIDAQIAMGTRKSKRKGPLDDLAATFLLQDYLDSKHFPSCDDGEENWHD